MRGLLLIGVLLVSAGPAFARAPWESPRNRNRWKRTLRKGPVAYRIDNAKVEGLDRRGRVRWTRTLPYHSQAAGIALNGDLVTVDYQRLIRLSPRGQERWRVRYQQKHRCGAPNGVALGYRDEIVVSCGYSLVKLDGKGRFQWQAWPFGNAWIREVFIDRRGRILTTGQRGVASVSPTGKRRWWTTLGFNLAPGPVAWTAKGQLLFVAYMAARHSPTYRGRRRYYRRRPPELHRLGRGGKILARQAVGYRFAAWPAHVKRPADGAHRLPW